MLDAGRHADTTLLVVDDNRHMIAIVKTILRGLGFERVVEELDPVRALQTLKAEPIDLVILDHKMAMIDGLDFVRLARGDAARRVAEIPIVMLTAYSERATVLAARDAGVSEFCCKPISARELYRKVISGLEHPRPFVRDFFYTGPCRRRRALRFAGPEKRCGT